MAILPRLSHFMRALPEILRRRPIAHVILNGGSWRKIFLDEVRDHIDLDRVHFVGKVPHPAYLRVLQISAAHVYLTYPFVLSWSMLEAMACGALVIGSDTAPVREVIRDGE